MRHLIMAAAIAAGLLSIAVDSSLAQSTQPRYYPARPTITPYLYLDRPDLGGLPNYYTYVRPLMEQRQFNVRQQYETEQIRQRLSVQEQRFEPAPAAPTGTGSVYMNRLQYYPAPRGLRR